MHIISPPSFCLSGLLNKPRLRSKKKFFDLGEALAYLTGHSGRRGGGLIICILGLKKCLTITTQDPQRRVDSQSHRCVSHNPKNNKDQYNWFPVLVIRDVFP
jgi:hypothetical protein